MGDFPATLEDIQTFVNNTGVRVSVFLRVQEKKIDKLRLGAIQYVKNDSVSLRLVKDECESGRYIYIKKLESLGHSVKNSPYKGRHVCPRCNEVVGKDKS